MQAVAGTHDRNAVIAPAHTGGFLRPGTPAHGRHPAQETQHQRGIQRHGTRAPGHGDAGLPASHAHAGTRRSTNSRPSCRNAPTGVGRKKPPRFGGLLVVVGASLGKKRRQHINFGWQVRLSRARNILLISRQLHWTGL